MTGNRPVLTVHPGPRPRVLDGTREVPDPTTHPATCDECGQEGHLIEPPNTSENPALLCVPCQEEEGSTTTG